MAVPRLYGKDIHHLGESVALALDRFPDTDLRFVEVGSNEGGTAMTLLRQIEKRTQNFVYYGIDMRFEPVDKHPKFKLLKGLSFEVHDYIPDPIHWIFIDACHCKSCVTKDLNTYLPKMHSDGVIVFHDVAETHQGKAANWNDWRELTDHHDPQVAVREGIQVLAALKELDLPSRGFPLWRPVVKQFAGGVAIFAKPTNIGTLP